MNELDPEPQHTQFGAKSSPIGSRKKSWTIHPSSWGFRTPRIFLEGSRPPYLNFFITKNNINRDFPGNEKTPEFGTFIFGFPKKKIPLPDDSLEWGDGAHNGCSRAAAGRGSGRPGRCPEGLRSRCGGRGAEFPSADGIAPLPQANGSGLDI